MLTPTYKANRKKADIPPLLGELTKYVTESYNAVSKAGYETDDLVASMWAKNPKESIIVSIDKDYLQFPATIYNYHYKHQTITTYTELRSKLLFLRTDDSRRYC